MPKVKQKIDPAVINQISQEFKQLAEVQAQGKTSGQFLSLVQDTCEKYKLKITDIEIQYFDAQQKQDIRSHLQSIAPFEETAKPAAKAKSKPHNTLDNTNTKGGGAQIKPNPALRPPVGLPIESISDQFIENVATNTTASSKQSNQLLLHFKMTMSNNLNKKHKNDLTYAKREKNEYNFKIKLTPY